MTFTPNGRRSHLMILMAAIKVISFQTVALIWILSVIYAERISKEQLINVHPKHRMDIKSYCAIKSLHSLSVFWFLKYIEENCTSTKLERAPAPLWVDGVVHNLVPVLSSENLVGVLQWYLHTPYDRDRWYLHTSYPYLIGTDLQKQTYNRLWISIDMNWKW